MCSSYLSGYDRKRNGEMGCSSPTKPFFTFVLVKRSKIRIMDKYILTNNEITGDKPSQQLFPKLSYIY